ncbi:MAG: ribosome-associated toxin RatA of RatAB toxin-antitoxin module [Ancylomarina sp.]|jgi:ribosome-associated toxin RatA of RatAB toxin-antitoxin module
MEKSLLFIPDISGFTEFVQSTEVEHSQHVIAELLEILLEANANEYQLAEVEGDALFFYQEEEIPSLESLLAKAEKMFTAFYSQLKLLEKNRICPCNACATAPNLNLKIIAHCGELQYMTVQNKRKPFGTEVIEAHRLMKNSIDSDNYILLSKNLSEAIHLGENYQSKLYDFKKGQDAYDGHDVNYLFSLIDSNSLKLEAFSPGKKIQFDSPPSLILEKEFPVSAEQLLEYITNYSYRHYWAEGVDKLHYNEHEVTKLGTEHVCVVNGKHLNFVTVSKEVEEGKLIYGELTTSPSPVDELYQFYIFTPVDENSCQLELEIYLKAKSPLKKLMIALLLKPIFKKSISKNLDSLHDFVEKRKL